MATVGEFMGSPLVTWVRTFNESIDPVDFQDLCDGVYLNDVMLQIDQREVELSGSINRLVKDSNARLQNWTFLLTNIKTYFEESLQQLLVMERPDIMSIVKEPHKECGLEALSRVLLQLLGCAVQCPRKDFYIDIITKQDVHVQEAIVEYIKQITNLPHNAISVDYRLDSDEEFKNFYNILNCVIQHRDSYAQMVALLTQERDYYQWELEERKGPLSPPSSLENHHLQKELSRCKTRLSGLQDELDEHDRMVQDLRNIQKDTKDNLSKVKAENLTLSKDAKAARNYRDELDAVREKAAMVGLYEREIVKYKEKMSQLEFYKGRVEELRADNSVLSEARQKMEDQLKMSQKQLHSLIEDMTHTQTALNDVNSERQTLEKKTQELIEENSQLEFERSRLKEGFGSRSAVRRLLSYSSSDLLGGSQTHLGLPISEEMNGTMTSEITKLEMENESLQVDLDATHKRLIETKHEVEKLTSDMGKELRTKAIELQRETNEQRKQLVHELTEDFETQVEAVKKESRLLRKHEVAKQQQQMAALIQQTETQQIQILSLEEKYTKELEHSLHVDEVISRLSEEKEQRQSVFKSMQETSQQQIRQLEEQVEALQTKPAIHHPDALSNYHANGSSSENIVDVAMRVSRETSKLQRASLQENETAVKNPAARVVDRPRSDCSNYYRTYNGSSMTSPPVSPKRYGSDAPRPTSSKGATADLNARPCETSIRHGGRHNGSNSSPRSASVTDFSELSQSESCDSVPRSPSRGTFENDTSFHRSDKLRSSATLGRCKSLLGFSFFRRGDKLRRSTPEKTSSQNVNGDKWCAPISSDGVPQKSRLHSGSNLSRSSTQVGKGVPRSRLVEHQRRHSSRSEIDRSTRSLATYHHRHSSSDKDSGYTNSLDTSTSDPRDDGHRLTSVHLVRQANGQADGQSVGSMPKTNEKWRMFVDMIVELQDKNQELTSEVSGLRHTTNAAKFSDDRMKMLEEKSLRLELENSKLRKICETLQFTLSGLNPYDKREYQFLSNT